MRVVISEFMDEAALGAFGPGVETGYAPALAEDRAALLSAVSGADGLIVRNRTRVDAELLDAAPRLRVVGRLGVGLDNIDLERCAARGVAVRPATGANTLAVAEYVTSATLALLRGVFGARKAMLAGDWPRAGLIGGEASGRVMGLIGFGGIARAVASRARALGMEIAAHDPHLGAEDPAWADVRRCALDELLATADVLSLHVPLTPDTRRMIDARAMARMKSGAILINTARGGVVDEAALAAALRSGALGGAALDVFEVEPLSAQAARVFEGLGNLILTPHIAGITDEANARVSQMTVAQVAEALADG